LCGPKKDLSNSQVTQKQAWVFPFWGDLSKEDFIQLSSVPVMLLGLNAQHVTYSDGFPGTQFLFYSHDIGHAEDILGHVFGDFPPPPKYVNTDVTIPDTFNKILDAVKSFSSTQKLQARESALQEFRRRV
jgi:hypothetical protein